MSPDPSTRAVIDRIVDGRHAVLLVGAAEDEHHVDVAALPADAREGTIVTVVCDAHTGDITSVAADTEATEQATSDQQQRLQRIRDTKRRGRL